MSDITGHRFGVVAIDGKVAERLREETARHWKLLLAIGLLCDLAGVYSIFVPIVASISVAVLVGWVLLFAGVVEFGHVFRRDPTWSWDTAWQLLVSVLTIVAGAWILIAPLSGAITLTVVLVAWFWALGVTRLLAWWRMRSVERSWMIGLNGAFSLVLGILIWADLPSSATWAIGLLVGIEMLLAGSVLIMTALAGRQLARMR
ncbi:MAG: hypothetical protein QOK22_55 [Gaiellaceae bacterium]|nr:hypothetical protein [Gaiellaceae bacterium]